jgi:hypothetical protein
MSTLAGIGYNNRYPAEAGRLSKAPLHVGPWR